MFLLPSIRLIALAVCVLVAGAAWADDGDPLAAVPDPSLGPQAVVRIQLEALRRNDAADRGIAVAFRFASPHNRRSTGPLPRFAGMIRNGPYAPMLRFTDAAYAPPRIANRGAVQQVTLYAPGRPPVSYVFYLTRQAGEGPLHECWMTDGVQVVPAAGTSV